MHYLLIYDVVDDYVSRRAPFRSEHLALANEFTERGELLLGGALTDPVDQAYLVFQVDSEHRIRQFVDRDPYVKNQLIRAWRIRPWNTVAGALLKPS